MNKVLVAISIIGIILTSLSCIKKISIKWEYIALLAFLLIIIQNCNVKTISKIETFDGSQVVFDKDAFINLNRIVKEIAGEGNLTVPGNLIVQGKTTLLDDCKIADKKQLETWFLKADTIEGKAYDANKIQLKPGTEIVNHGNSKVRLSENGNCTLNNLTADTSITVGNDNNKKMIIKQNRIGNVNAGDLRFDHDGWIRNSKPNCDAISDNCYTGKGIAANELYAKTALSCFYGNSGMRIRPGKIGNPQAGDISFDGDGWKRCFNYGTGTYNKGIAAKNLYAEGRSDFANVVVHGTSTFHNNCTLSDGKQFHFKNKAHAKFSGNQAEQDGNDGKIGCNIWGDGLNIVGVGRPRKTRIWGDNYMVDSSITFPVENKKRHRLNFVNPNNKDDVSIIYSAGEKGGGAAFHNFF